MKLRIISIKQLKRDKKENRIKQKVRLGQVEVNWTLYKVLKLPLLHKPFPQHSMHFVPASSMDQY